MSLAKLAAEGAVMLDRRRCLEIFAIQWREPALSLDGRWRENGPHGAE